MAAARPVGTYAMRIPPGDILFPAVPEFSPMFRVTMAAIDPSEEPDIDASDNKQKPRATLKIVRVPDAMVDSEDDDSDDFDEDDEEDEEDDEGVNGGPSEKKAVKNTSQDDGGDDEDEAMDDDSDEEAAAEALLAKLMSATKKGKSKAIDGKEDEDDEDEDDSDASLGMDECVVCTLDPEKVYQQPIDLHIAEGERVFFKVSGSLTVHLTGNYLMPLDEDDDDDDDEYDLSPDEDEELDGLDALVDGDESDELDDLDDPRLVEVPTDEEEDEVEPKALSAPSKKGKNKRPAEEDEEEASLDNIMAKSLKQEEVEQPKKKLTKAEKKAAKKLKNNEGEAAAAPEPPKKEGAQANGTGSDTDKKKVQFAKNLEQGPTPSKNDTKKEGKKPVSVSLGVKDVNGVTVDDRKIGSGPAAKKGSRLEMRYIGKLDNGKVFDSNKSGKPFSFKLGSGEVIKGWEVGLMGISSGGERRLIIPPHMAYGKKALPGIPPNSKLTFDIKCLSVK